MSMTFREIAAMALDEWEAEDAAPADGGAAPAPAGGDAAGSDAPTNKAAAALAFNMQQHLEQYHDGQQPKGQCKYMDNLKKQAKALGVADKVPGLRGEGDSSGGGGVDDAEVKNSEEWKQYITDRQVQDATFKEKLKALGIENPELNGAGYNEEQMKVVEEWHKAIDERRDKYLKEALGDAEAHCVEQLATIIDAGGEKAEKALKLAEEIAAKYGEDDPRNLGAKKMIDRAERKKQKEEFDKRQAELEAKEKELKEREEAMEREKGEGERTASVQQQEGENGNLGEVKVGNKTYVDLSGKGFWEGMAAAFKAGWEGKEIITDWDKMSGRWDQIRQKMTKAQKKNYEGLTNGLAQYLQEEANKAAAAQFEKLLGEESGLTDEQKAYVAQLYANWANDDASKTKTLKELNRYLKEQGIESETETKTSSNTPLKPNDKPYTGPLASTKLLDKVSDEESDTKYGDDAALSIAGKLNSLGSLVINDIDEVNVGPSATSIVLSVDKENFNAAKFTSSAVRKELQMALPAGSKIGNLTILGDNKVKIEFSNNKMRDVSFRGVMDSDEWKEQSKKMGIPVALGKDSSGKDIVKDITKMPHTMITGETNSGKSVCLKAMITSTQMAKTPRQYQQVLIDPKRQEFGEQTGSPYNFVPVQFTPEGASRALATVKEEMERRQKLMGVDPSKYSGEDNTHIESEATKLDAYNSGKSESDQLPYMALYIDELAALTKDPKYGKQISQDLDQILAQARSVGINVVLSTQRADVASVAGAMKANIPGRITFKASADDHVATSEAKSLSGQGDMIITEADGKKTRGRGAYIKDSEFSKVATFYRDNYDSQSGTPDGSAAPSPSPSPETAAPSGGAAPAADPASNGGGHSDK